MNKILLLSILMIVSFAIKSEAQLFTKPSNPYGTISNRGSFDSTIYIPTSCGVPIDSTYLFSYGFGGRGQKLAKGALYYDSCGHHLYVWDPSYGVKQWHVVDSGGTGGGADSSIFWTVYRADTSTQNLYNALAGKQSLITLGTTSQYFDGTLALRAFPTSLSAFTNDPGYLTSILDTNSITGGGYAGSKLQLVNDVASPGANMTYGTNGSGTKMWVPAATGSGTVTSIATGFGLLGGTITSSGTLYVDSTKVPTLYFANKTYLPFSDSASMLSPYARKTFLSGAAPITYSSSTGIIGADTSKGSTSLATYPQLEYSFDSIHVVPYTNTGITLLRFSNDSLRPKPIVAGTSITLTQNNDSTVTISSTALANVSYADRDTVTKTSHGFSNLMPIYLDSTGTWQKSDTNHLAMGVVIDSLTQNAFVVGYSGVFSVTNSLSVGRYYFVSEPAGSISTTSPNISQPVLIPMSDSTVMIRLYRPHDFASQTGGSPNSNVGLGFRWAIPNTNNIKTSFAGSGIGLDSTSNTNGITITNTGITSLAGTTNQIAISSSTGSSTLSIPSLFSITNLTTSGTNIFSGTTYGGSSLNPKADAIIQDTTTGQIYRRSAQFVDTTGIANGDVVTWSSSGSKFIVAAPSAPDSATFAGLGLTKSISGSSITLNADTSYLVTKGSNQTVSGNKTFSGTIDLTGNTSAIKPNVVVIDTTSGQLFHESAQFIDTTGASSGKIVYWNGTRFALETNSGGATDSAVLAGNGIIKSLSGTNITLTANTSTANTGLTTLYQAGLRVKYSDTGSMLSPYTLGSGTSTQFAYFNGSRSLTSTSTMTTDGTTNTMVNSLSGSSAASLLSLTPTWNTTGSPTAIKLNVTNTASGSSSKLLDLQVGGVSQFSITKAGVAQLGGSTSGTMFFTNSSTANYISAGPSGNRSDFNLGTFYISTGRSTSTGWCVGSTTSASDPNTYGHGVWNAVSTTVPQLVAAYDATHYTTFEANSSNYLQLGNLGGMTILDGAFQTGNSSTDSIWCFRYSSTGDTLTKLPYPSAPTLYYQTIQSNTTSQTQRSKLNFGTEFTIADNSSNGSTDVSVNAIAESKVTNLTSDLSAKAPLASPALTGTPTVPTASAGTNTTQAASTAFVTGAIASIPAGCQFVQSTGASVSGTSEQTWLGTGFTGYNSLAIPSANLTVAGKAYHFKISGANFSLASGHTMTIRIYLGSTVLASGTMTGPAISGPVSIEGELYISGVSGSTTTINVDAMAKNMSNLVAINTFTGTTPTVTNTSSLNLNITLQFSNTESTSITSYNGIVQEIN